MPDSREKPGVEPALKVPMTPNHLNVHDTIFGGTILSYIDLAGSVHCRQSGCERVVTIGLKEVEFKHPVYAGDVVSLYGTTKNVGRTSMTVRIDVWAERFARPHEVEWVTEAEITYVNIDGKTHRPVPIDNQD